MEPKKRTDRNRAIDFLKIESEEDERSEDDSFAETPSKARERDDSTTNSPLEKDASARPVQTIDSSNSVITHLGAAMLGSIVTLFVIGLTFGWPLESDERKVNDLLSVISKMDRNEVLKRSEADIDAFKAPMKRSLSKSGGKDDSNSEMSDAELNELLKENHLPTMPREDSSTAGSDLNSPATKTVTPPAPSAKPNITYSNVAPPPKSIALPPLTRLYPRNGSKLPSAAPGALPILASPYYPDQAPPSMKPKPKAKAKPTLPPPPAIKASSGVRLPAQISSVDMIAKSDRSYDPSRDTDQAIIETRRSLAGSPNDPLLYLQLEKLYRQKMGELNRQDDIVLYRTLADGARDKAKELLSGSGH